MLLQGECEHLSTAGSAYGEGHEPDEREWQADIEGDGGPDEDLLVGHRDWEAFSEKCVSAESDWRADGEVPIPGGQDGTGFMDKSYPAGFQEFFVKYLLAMKKVKSFDSERRKLESRIEKLTKQIAVLEKAVEDNRSVTIQWSDYQ